MQRRATGRHRVLNTEEEEESPEDGGGCAAYTKGPPQESLRVEGADLQGFSLAQYHQFLVELYGDQLPHHDGEHLGEGVADDTIWQQRWQRMDA